MRQRAAHAVTARGHLAACTLSFSARYVLVCLTVFASLPLQMWGLRHVHCCVVTSPLCALCVSVLWLMPVRPQHVVLLYGVYACQPVSLQVPPFLSAVLATPSCSAMLQPRPLHCMPCGIRADTWPTDVTAAVAACMAVAGFPRVGLLGFCFGGGRVVDALGNSRTDLLESSAAPPATYCDVRASTASIDEDLLLCTSPPTPWAYVCGVAFYGTRIDLSALARVRQPLRLAFAGEDALVPHDFIEEMRSVRARRPSGGQGGPGGPPDAVQISVEAGAPHGFVHQSGKQGEAGDRVLARAELFLRKHLLQEADILV